MTSTNQQKTQTVALSVLAMLYVVGCETGGSQNSSSNGSESSQQYHAYNVNAYPLNKVVCDPMGGGGGTTAPKQGIKAELYYRTQNQPRYYKAQDYISYTKKAAQDIFFTEMFVPTRLFEIGFVTQTSGVLKDDSGNKLIEYFGLKMNTTIRLGANNPEGYYEFALLSDDGSVMKINKNGSWSEVINNDGDHSTRLGCSSQMLKMDRATKLETEILYYQGPRYHISNILLWRQVDPNRGAGQDQACGIAGNDTWFSIDPNNPQPKTAYNELLSRGWKVVQAENFFLPEESTETTQYNPCTSGTAPTISNLRITELVSTDVWVNWSTDLPATSQLMITEVATGNVIFTTSDNVLRTSHNIHHSGLKPNTRYQLKAVNISEDLGKAISNPLDFTTP